MKLRAQHNEFSRLTERFLHEMLALSPVGATAADYHRHVDERTGRQVLLDEHLDDFSAAGLNRQREVIRGLRSEAAKFAAARLDAAERIDLAIMRNALDDAEFELNRVQAHRHNPILYTNSPGFAIFQPMVQDYAPLEMRLKHIFARLEELPVFLAAARANLADTDPVFTEAEAKLIRTKLAYTQLPMYFVGLVEWQSIREAVERAESVKFNLKAFHDRALGVGALPLNELRKWMLAGESSEHRAGTAH